MKLQPIRDIRSLPEQSLIPKRYADGLEVLSDKDKVVAAGFIRLTSEVIVVMDRAAPTIERVAALELLIGAGVYSSQKLKLTDMHAFLTGPAEKQLGRLLKRKYGFVSHTGEVLVLNI